MATIIGFDFGNINSFLSFIQDMDPDTRMGGVCRDLLRSDRTGGIPSTFFYSDQRGIQLGYEADAAVPASSRVRLLKRHLNQEFTLPRRAGKPETRTFSYDEAIRMVAEYCIRRANRILQDNYHETTNLVALAYPAMYTSAQRKHLVHLVESATLEDGTHVEVCGTIAEPAASALDYLAENSQMEEKTVLTYDLGGGTFDVSLVTVYPAGRRRADGNVYYYDIHASDGCAVGGADFDQVMFRQLEAKMSGPVQGNQREVLLRTAESTKINLSDNETAWPDITDPDTGDYYDIEITRKEFEAASRHLLEQTIACTRQMLRDHPGQKPENIVLTGGASQMPMVKQALEEAFPEYRGKVIFHRPSKAISYGAARYGTEEPDDDPQASVGPAVQRTQREIGIRYFRGPDDVKGHLGTIIPAGTEIPFQMPKPEWVHPVKDGQTEILYRVYEARVDHPDRYEVERDYTKIMELTLHFDQPEPMTKQTCVRLDIDQVGLLQEEAWDPDAPDKPRVRTTEQLCNLS